MSTCTHTHAHRYSKQPMMSWSTFHTLQSSLQCPHPVGHWITVPYQSHCPWVKVVRKVVSCNTSILQSNGGWHLYRHPPRGLLCREVGKTNQSCILENIFNENPSITLLYNMCTLSLTDLFSNFSLCRLLALVFRHITSYKQTLPSLHRQHYQ